MPKIVDYATALAQLQGQGLVCNYPMSGAFGFPQGQEIFIRGWIGPPDATIRASMQDRIFLFPQPYETNLCTAVTEMWENGLAGAAWVMPLSHWHFEIHDGSRDWMAGLLTDVQLDPKALENRADGSAIEFSLQESSHFIWMIEGLLKGLRVSDFLIAFPGKPALCTIHHHKQLWWTTTDAGLIEPIKSCEVI